MIKTRTTAAVLAVATAVTLAGCSSSGSGGGGVSTSQLEAKLKSNAQISALKQQYGNKIDINKFVDCVAVTLKKDVNASDLQKYVAGKIPVTSIKPKSSASKSDAKSDFISCAKSSVKS